MLILQITSEESMKGLTKIGFDENKASEKIEMVLLGLYALKAAAINALIDSPEKAYYLIEYCLRYMEHLSPKLFLISETDFRQLFDERDRQYSSQLGEQTIPMNPVIVVGHQFAANIGKSSEEISKWASTMFHGWFQSTVEHLKGLDKKVDLVQ